MNLGKIAAGVLKTVAPLALDALPGPIGGLAKSVLGKALGTDDEEEIEAKLVEASPETLLAIKNVDKDLRTEMRRLGIEEQRIYLQDTQDARGLAKHLGKIWPQFTIVTMLTLLIALIVWQLFYAAPPEGSRDALLIILGNLMTAWGGAIAFFVGTTKSSQDKNALGRVN